jgi:hypothetical protein
MADGAPADSFTAVLVAKGYDRFLRGQLFEPWAEDTSSARSA